MRIKTFRSILYVCLLFVMVIGAVGCTPTAPAPAEEHIRTG